MNRFPTCTFLLSLIPPPGGSADGRTVYHQQTLGTSRIPWSYPIVIGVSYLTFYCRVRKGVVNKAERRGLEPRTGALLLFELLKLAGPIYKAHREFLCRESQHISGRTRPSDLLSPHDSWAALDRQTLQAKPRLLRTTTPTHANCTIISLGSLRAILLVLK
jgi:hypothetical protein